MFNHDILICMLFTENFEFRFDLSYQDMLYKTHKKCGPWLNCRIDLSLNCLLGISAEIFQGRDQTWFFMY